MRTLLRCLSALVLAIAVFSLAAAFAFPARAQSFTTFDDWMLGCDNRRHCVALGLEPGENVNGVYVRVLRSGEGAPSPRSRSPPSGHAGPLRLAFDDPALPALPGLAASQPQRGESVEVTLPRGSRPGWWCGCCGSEAARERAPKSAVASERVRGGHR